MAKIIKAATPPTTPPITAPRLDAVPDLLGTDGVMVLAGLEPRIEGKAVTRVASEVADAVDFAVVAGVSRAVCVSEVAAVFKVIDTVSAESTAFDVDVDDDNEVDESSDEVVDEDVVIALRGIPILAVIAANPATEAVLGTSVLDASFSS
jgi:hypothetical protein